MIRDSEKGEASEDIAKFIFPDGRQIKLTKMQVEIFKAMEHAKKGGRFIPLHRPVK